MKFKYFMRGLGVGILFCSLIIFAAYETSPNKLFTDEEVIARAKQLGMVEAQSSLDKMLKDASTSEDTTEQAGDEKQPQGTEEYDTSTKTQGQDADISKAGTEGTTETAKTTENRQEPQDKQPSTADAPGVKPPTTTETPEPKSPTTTETSEPKPPTTTETAGSTEDGVVTKTITVKRGMDSSSVAALLEREGIIEDAHDFDSYLDKNGYSTRIRIGTYVVKSSDSYKTLAKIITKTN